MNIKLVIEKLESLPESLQILVFDYIEFLAHKYSDEYNNKYLKEENLPDNLKILLQERLEKYHRNPEKVKNWEEIEQRLLKKHNYEI